MLTPFLLALGFCLSGPLSGKKPNILCILVDDLGYSDLSSFGGKDIRTPAIDNLMNSGLRLNQFYANCTVCTPTRASLMTGRYPDLVGATWSDSSEPGKQLGVFQPHRPYPARADEPGGLSHWNGWEMAPRL